jgi:hypothetical protein
MHVRCAWCALPLGEKEPLGDNSTSHAICPDCVARLRAGPACAPAPGKPELPRGGGPPAGPPPGR